MARRSSAVRRRKPSFFKVLVGDFSNRLQIPPAFLVHFDGKEPQQFHLRTSAGTWRVNVEKVNDKYIFQKGWKKFVYDNDLKICEFLVFRYARNFRFYVDIYGRNGCKRKFVMAVGKKDRSLEEGHGNIVHRQTPRFGKQNVDNQGLKGSAYGRTRTSQAIFHIKDEEPDATDSETSMHPLTTSTRKSIAHQRHKDFESGNPFFKVSMRWSYIHKGYLNLPAKFAKAHLNEQPSTITLRISDGRTWSVNFSFRDNRYRRILGGWGGFVRDNDLKVGDVCLFVLINKSEFLFEAVFYRKTEAANHTVLPSNVVQTKTSRHGKKDVDNQDLKASAYGRTRTSQAIIHIKDEVPDDDTESETSMHPLATSTGKSIALPRDIGFESENPFFKVAMRYSDIHNSYLALPAKFFKAHLTEQPSTVTLQVSDGRTWPVNLLFLEGGCQILGGWRAFVLDNDIEVGDVCVFVLISKSEFLFEAVIYRQTDLAANCTLSPGKPWKRMN